MTNPLLAAIRPFVLGQQPLIYLQSSEEQRVLDTLTTLVSECFDDGSVTTWTCIDGLTKADDTVVPDTTNPVAALRHITAERPTGFVVMKDLSAFMERPDVARALRDAYCQLQSHHTHIIVVSPVCVIPKSLEKEIGLVELPLPSIDELLAQVLEVNAAYPDATIDEALRDEIALSLKGLTLNEVSHLMHRVLRAGIVDAETLLNAIFVEKETLVKKSGYLEFVPPRFDMNQIGGLENLKGWLHKRAAIFNQEAVSAGLPIPKGILMMGVSGCGKSLCAKAVSSLWKVPLFRLDMNLVFSGRFGSPEETFHQALKTIESVAPAVLWIDEIENGLGMTGDGGHNQNHIFSAFLTWMQEKPPLIFVAATANNIHSLPAEVIRKGRFDQVFFCDLPNEDERRDIMNIHLRHNGANPEDFDLKYLVVATDGWNGAEIEQAVISARIDAYQDKRTFTTDDIERHTRSIVPLSETMAEQIKAIRNWAWGRATTASKTKKKFE